MGDHVTKDVKLKFHGKPKAYAEFLKKMHDDEMNNEGNSTANSSENEDDITINFVTFKVEGMDYSNESSFQDSSNQDDSHPPIENEDNQDSTNESQDTENPSMGNSFQDSSNQDDSHPPIKTHSKPENQYNEDPKNPKIPTNEITNSNSNEIQLSDKDQNNQHDYPNESSFQDSSNQDDSHPPIENEDNQDSTNKSQDTENPSMGNSFQDSSNHDDSHPPIKTHSKPENQDNEDPTNPKIPTNEITNSNSNEIQLSNEDQNNQHDDSNQESMDTGTSVIERKLSLRSYKKSCAVDRYRGTIKVDRKLSQRKPSVKKTTKNKPLVRPYGTETAIEEYSDTEWPIEPVAKCTINGIPHILHKWKNDILTATQSSHVQLDPETLLEEYDPKKHGTYKTQWDVKNETEKQIIRRNVQIRGNQFYVCAYCGCRSGHLGLRSNTVQHMLKCINGATMESVLKDIEKGKVTEEVFQNTKGIKRGRRTSNN